MEGRQKNEPSGEYDTNILFWLQGAKLTIVFALLTNRQPPVSKTCQIFSRTMETTKISFAGTDFEDLGNGDLVT